MSATPAAQLARLKLAYPGYQISRGLAGFVAVHRQSGERIGRPTVPELWHALEYGPDRQPKPGK